MESIETVPLNSFHKRVVAFTSTGAFCDGYILGVIGFAIPLMSNSFSISSIWAGLIGASALIGIFIGGLVFGYLTDLIGRQRLFLIDLLVFIVASILQFFATDVSQIFVLRLIMGIAIGADYAIATALLAEFTPKAHRVTLMTFLVFMLYVGILVAYVIGYFLVPVGGGIWRWLLASSAIPAIIGVLMRIGAPESPRWLVSKGRYEEAKIIAQKYLGSSNIDESETHKDISYFSMFKGGYWKRTIFIAGFWSCQVIPVYAVLTFTPRFLELFNIEDSALGAVIVTSMNLVGLLLVILIIKHIKRKLILEFSFIIMSVDFIILGFFHETLTGLAILGFILFNIVVTGASIFQFLYPNELFPTKIRASAAGFGTATSRIGAAIGTFGVPWMLMTLGIDNTMYIFAGVSLAGFVITWLLAPDIDNLTLSESSQI